MSDSKSTKNSNNLLVTPSNVRSSKLMPVLSLPSDKEWGIDSVTLSIPVSSDVPELAHCDWDYTDGKVGHGFDKSKYVSNFLFNNANVRVSYSPIYGRIFVSFNAARLVTGKSTELLQPSALARLVQALLLDIVGQMPVLPTCMQILDGALEFLPEWQSQIAFTRIDFARNFSIESPELVKHFLSRIRCAYQKTVHYYFDDEGWTRANVTKSQGIDRMYDKSAELRGLELDEKFHWDTHIFRFEAQLQKDRLKKFDVKTLDKITDAAVWSTLESRWKAGNWGISLPGEGSVFELIQSIPEPKQLEFIGYLGAHEAGLQDKLNKKKMDSFGRLCKRLSVIPGRPIRDYGLMNQKLDLWAGCVIADKSTKCK